MMHDLQKVNLQVFSDEECENIHATTGPSSRLYHLCAGVVGGGKGQCNVIYFYFLQITVFLYLFSAGRLW